MENPQSRRFETFLLKKIKLSHFRGALTFWDSNPEGPMRMGYQRSRWVQMEAAKHATPESIRRRIAYETEQVRILTSAGLTNGHMGQALESHRELIRVLTERLADFR